MQKAKIMPKGPQSYSKAWRKECSQEVPTSPWTFNPTFVSTIMAKNYSLFALEFKLQQEEKGEEKKDSSF